MQRSRDQLFARSRFAANADSRFASRDLPDLGHHVTHRWACPDDVVPPEPPLQIAVFIFKAREAHGVLDREEQFFSGDRLFEEIDGPEASSSHSHLNRGLSRHHHRRRRHANILEIFE